MDVGSGWARWAIAYPGFDSFRVQAEDQIINFLFIACLLKISVILSEFNNDNYYIRGVNDGWAEWAVAHPGFGRHV